MQTYLDVGGYISNCQPQTIFVLPQDPFIKLLHGVPLAGVEGGLLRAHGERVELRE
jgi:hypothetical protein